MYRKAEGPRWHGPGRIVGFDHNVLWTLHQKTPVAVAAGRARPANVSEILAHMVLGDRISERTIDQFRAAGLQQGFVDISGRRRMRSDVEVGEQDEEQEQPLVSSWNRDRRLQELRLEEPRALRVKASPSSQRPNLQHHWKTHGCVETWMEHQIQEFDL